MLRKRITARPNSASLQTAKVTGKVVSNAQQQPQQQQQQPQQASQPQPAPTPPPPGEAPAAPIEQSTPTPNAATVTDSRVQEAINQLTGQRFEPIKSLSLRSSANKNVKLKDLLFFNPPMTKDQKRHKKSVSLSKKSEKKKNATNNEQNEDEPEDEVQTTPTRTPSAAETTTTTTTTNTESQSSNGPSIVPKVKIGPDGNLVLDESSTVINRKNLIKEQEAIVEDNEDIISKTNYDSYRRRPSQTSQTKWSNEDTQKFYQALTILGTDFSMMESLLFSGLRSRTELHKKFKREERVNKLKIDIALSNRISLNSEELEDLREVFNS